ncbi:MAG TPA: hypothetical protein PLH11_12370 [Gemmobacter sp.]|nr:hypothetical protein [Gemmobacter sp.]
MTAPISTTRGRVHIQSVEQAENGALSVAFKIENDTQASICFYDAQVNFLRDFMTADMRWAIFDAAEHGFPDFLFDGTVYQNHVITRIEPGAARSKWLVVQPFEKAVLGNEAVEVGPVPDGQSAIMRVGVFIVNCREQPSRLARGKVDFKAVFSEFQDISRYGEGLWRRGGAQLGE